jgi:hypothetical protein
MMDMDYCCHGGIGFISGGYGVPNLTDINAEGLSNVFSSPRNTPFFSAQHHHQHRQEHMHMKRDPDDDYLHMDSSVPGGGNNQVTEDCNMYIHYNNSYQPQYQCDHNAAHRAYPDDRLYCESGVHSPTTRDHNNHDSLSVLADTFIASAEKDRHRQEGILSLFAANPSSSSHQVGMTIYSSEQDYNNYQGNTTVGELSQIIKSDDSPTTSLQDGDQLGDVSFSTLADLSMLRTTSPSACNHLLSTNTDGDGALGMHHNIVQLSPIAAKSPDISMTPYLNCLTLDSRSSSSQGSRPSPSDMKNHTNDNDDAASFSAVPSSSTNEPQQELHHHQQQPSILSRSLFSTTSKRKRASIYDSSSSTGDADLLNLTNVAPFTSDAAFVSMR